MKSIKRMPAGLAVILLLMWLPACSQGQRLESGSLQAQKIANAEAPAQPLPPAGPTDAAVLPPAFAAASDTAASTAKPASGSSPEASGQLPSTGAVQPVSEQHFNAVSTISSAPPSAAAGTQQSAATTQREEALATAPIRPVSETAPDLNEPFLTEYETQAVALVNTRREEEGLPPLVVTASLRDTAHLRVTELTQSYSHTRPDGTRFFTAFPPSNAYGENAARGQQTPGAVMESWMGSEAHRANILDPSFTRIGVGCIRQGDTLYWVQCFTGG